MAESAKAVPYDQRLGRWAAPYLARLGITANQVTGVSLLLGLAGAALIALGEAAYANWGAGLFVLARVLDHFDGELARYTETYSRFGYYFDYFTGMVSYAALFAALALHVSQGWLGDWAWLIGGVTVLAAALSAPLNVMIDQEKGSGYGVAVGYPGIAGFELEDGIYLIAPVAWLGLLSPFFVLVGIGATLYAFWTLWCLVRLRLARRSSSAAS